MAVELAFMIPVFVLFAVAALQFQSMMRAGMAAITASNFDARTRAVRNNASIASSRSYRRVVGRATRRAELFGGGASIFRPYSQMDARTSMLSGVGKERGGRVLAVWQIY